MKDCTIRLRMDAGEIPSHARSIRLGHMPLPMLGLGLEVTGQRVEADHAVLACRISGEDRWCRRCGCQGICRDTVVRRLAHEPCGWRPTILHVSVRRYRCETCAHVWRQDMSQAADPRAKLSRAAVRWALTGLVVHHLTVARVAQALGVSWKSRQYCCPG